MAEHWHHDGKIQPPRQRARDEARRDSQAPGRYRSDMAVEQSRDGNHVEGRITSVR